ncbi:MAG: META domain-containing protein [Chloroflexota bacterium]
MKVRRTLRGSVGLLVFISFLSFSMPVQLGFAKSEVMSGQGIVPAYNQQAPSSTPAPAPAPAQVPRASTSGASASVAALVNWPWRVVSFRMNGMSTRPLSEAPSPMSAVFTEDGSVAGGSGCNTYRGSYLIDGSTITFSQMATTRRACVQPGVMEQEQAFLAALTAVRRFSATGEMLRLLDDAGTEQITLMRPAVQPVPARPSSQSEPSAPDSSVSIQQSAPSSATSIQLPDGTVCRFAGTGATLAFEGKRVNYTCDESGEQSSVILGAPTLQAGTLSFERGYVQRTADEFVLASADTMSVPILELVLVNGERCLAAGQGATLAFGGKRANYTCGSPEVVLLGDPATPSPHWTIERAALARGSDGFSVDSSAQTAIDMVIGVSPTMGS